MSDIVEISRNVLYNENVVTLTLEFSRDGEGNLYESEEQEKSNIRRVMDAARKSLDYITSQKIRDIRGKYTDDPELFGKILGFPEGAMTKYENMDIPNRLDGYLIEAQEEPLVFLGSLLRKRYLLTFDVFYRLLETTLGLKDIRIDKKSVENLRDKWGDYTNANFFIEYVTTLGGGTFTYNDYEKITHGYQEDMKYMKTRINEYPKDVIKIEYLKEEIQARLLEEKINMELGFKTYSIKGWSKDWEDRQDEVEDLRP